MTGDQQQQVWLNRQADQIERTFSSMSLPVRVNGGQVREGRVRYHLTPLGSTRLEALEEMKLELAGQLGARQVLIAPETGGLALDVAAEPEPDLRLLPLMQAIGDLPPRSAVIGMTAQDHPLTLCLRDPASQHLLISGPVGSGKSELLRTLLLSLALTSRPAQLQAVGIDLSGRELACLESLPHALTDLGSGPGFALELLEWLDGEIDRRRQSSVADPAIVLLVDDWDRLLPNIAGRAQAAMCKCLTVGADVGVHLLLAAAEFGQNVGWLAEGQGVCTARAGSQPGQFEFRGGELEVMASVAWIPAVELSAAVELAQCPSTSWASPRVTSALPASLS
ncbi:MAG: FtsK/SpoIIIE domain-containing protein [Anaerolineales bacterium]